MKDKVSSFKEKLKAKRDGGRQGGEVKVPIKGFLGEHKRLATTLRSGTAPERHAEASRQEGEARKARVRQRLQGAGHPSK